jgi:Cys-rich repeat protein
MPSKLLFTVFAVACCTVVIFSKPAWACSAAGGGCAVNGDCCAAAPFCNLGTGKCETTQETGGICTKKSDCLPDTSTDTFYCGAPAVGGESTPLVCCDWQNNLYPPAGVGAQCEHGSDCCSGLCDFNEVQGNQFTCCSLPGMGCQNDVDCCNPNDTHTGLRCGTTFDVNPSTCCITSGTTCTVASECCRGECNAATGTCCVSDNASCLADIDCCPGKSHCRTPGGNGTCVQCIRDSDCSNGFECDNNACVACNPVPAMCGDPGDCCSGVCNGIACAPNNTVGGICQKDSDCGAGLYCQNASHTCAAQVAYGKPCTQSDACAQGQCIVLNHHTVCAPNPVCDQNKSDPGYDTCCTASGATCCPSGFCLPNDAPCCSGTCQSNGTCK